MNASAQILVEVQVASDRDGIPAAADIQHWAMTTLGALHTHAQLCVRIVDEAEGTELNETYRGRTGPTNVLSFNFDATELTDPPLLGDVIICAPVVDREAQAQDKSASAHYAHMVVHGTLHLLGHDHETDSQASEMEALERDIIAGFGFANPYASESPP